MPRSKPSKGYERLCAIQLKNKESLFVSPDVRRENADLDTESLFLTYRMCNVAEIQVPEALVYNETVQIPVQFDSLIERSLLYVIAKPIVESIVSPIT